MRKRSASATREGLTFLHPFDDPAVINGQGTIGLELAGAGARPGGSGGAHRRRRPHQRRGLRPEGKQSRPFAWWGCKLSGCPPWLRAIRHGSPVTLPAEATIADGIAVRRAGDLTVPLVEALCRRDRHRQMKKRLPMPSWC